jgi:hypothetical protein
MHELRERGVGADPGRGRAPRPRLVVIGVGFGALGAALRLGWRECAQRAHAHIRGGRQAITEGRPIAADPRGGAA